MFWYLLTCLIYVLYIISEDSDVVLIELNLVSDQFCFDHFDHLDGWELKVHLLVHSVMHFVFLCDVKEEQDSNRIIVVIVTDFKILLLFSRSVVSNCLHPHGLQHARLPYPSLSPGACSNSCPLIESVVSSNHPILCHPFLLPSIFPSIRVFSNESALGIRWPKYWSLILNYYSTRRQNVGFILTPAPNRHRLGQKITVAALVNVWDIFQCVKISCIVHLSLCFFISVSNKNS